MSVNSPLKTPNISQWLKNTTVILQEAGIDSARLDAEIILAHTIKKSRTYLHAHGDEILDFRIVDIADARVDLRLDHTPIAYIIGHKDFYGRPFKVTPATLIPRPESEDIITLLLDIVPAEQPLDGIASRQLVDVGTGTGCLGITAKLERPQLDVTLVDISRHALAVAETNARRLHADVMILRSDLLSNYHLVADIIIANLPYVDRSWKRSADTDHEPSIALFADDDGLKLIKRLIDQTKISLVGGGHLLLEADPRQHQMITRYAEVRGLARVAKRGYILHFQKNAS